MNALELSDNISLDNCHLDLEDRKSIATVLRQQAAEIDSLKDRLMLARQTLDIIDGWTKK